ncbi:MAG: CHASE2 domain-containing protein [Thiobacillus sp.]|nr:CHASE2 domain-containing protein [Thiobacillus sp.]
MHHPPEFSGRLSRKWGYGILLLGLSVSIVLGIVGRMETGFPAQWSHLFLDSFLKYSANGKTAQNAVVIDIDDASLSAAGQWPWPRYRMASLVQAIADGKPAAIGLDILFSEPDRTSLNNIQKSFKQDFDLDISFVGASPGLSDNDGYFGKILSGTGAVGARYFYFDHISKAEISTKPEFHFTGRTDLLSLNDAPGVLNNTYEISSQLKFSGFLNNQPDSDGMLRRIPLLIQHRGVIYPHLSLATFMRSLGVDSAVIEEDGNGPVIHVGNHSIPINKNGFALLRFNGKPHLYPAISAVDILNGSSHPAADINGKIVFIGSSAAALNDLHSTIFDPQFPGLKSQAVIIENIMADSFIREPSWAETAILLACIATGLLLAALFIFLREPVQLFLGTATLAGIILWVSIYLFQSAGIFISPGPPILATGVLFTLFTATRFVIEKRHAYVWFTKLANARQVIMESMAAVAETRDPETGAHIKRTQHYVKSIAEKLRDTGNYPEILTQEYIDLLFVSAPLHDIGKVGVPDHILLKQGKLTEEEFELMKKHAEYGKNIIYSTAKKIEGDNFLIIAGEIASTHHERWDGTGYPLGLAGHNIPLSGRIMAVADVYDALISRRCYKPPFPHEESVRIMREARGKIFDPVVLDAFFSIEEKIRETASRYRDEGERVLGDL